MGIPAVRELFADATSNLDYAERFEAYKTELNKSLNRPIRGGMSAEQHRVHTALTSPTLTKSISADLASSIEQQLAGNSFIGKDLDLAGPGSTAGLHQYDLEAPAKNLVPRKTPLRNRIARTKGIGVAHEYKRITGFTGSGTGGVGMFHPGLAETDTTTFGSLNLRRGKIIDYAGDDITVPFRSFSVSDRVTWNAQLAGVGYEDIRQLSSTSSLYSAMLLEERMLLSGRGTASGFSGALGTPGTPTVTTPAASGGQTAVTGVSTNAYITIIAKTMWGTTACSAVGNSAFTAGDVVSATWTQVPGAESYDVYLGGGSSAPGLAAMYLVGTTAANTLIVQGALNTSATAASTVDPSTNPSAFANGYDGILAYVLDPSQSGYLDYLNGPLTSDSPFQDAFSTMFDANQADPQTILCNGHDRRVLSDILKSSSSSNYQIMIQNGADGVVGALATSVQNEVTGSMVDLDVHPFMPRGVMPIMSWQLPIPDSQISNCWAVVNVQDVMGVAWPQIEFTYDYSVYWQGTFCAYAPGFSGAIAGISAS